MKRRNSPKHGMRLYRWQATWWWIAPALIGTIAVWSVLPVVARGLPPEVLLAGIALILGVAYFFQQQRSRRRNERRPKIGGSVSPISLGCDGREVQLILMARLHSDTAGFVHHYVIINAKGRASGRGTRRRCACPDGLTSARRVLEAWASDWGRRPGPRRRHDRPWSLSPPGGRLLRHTSAPRPCSLRPG